MTFALVVVMAAAQLEAAPSVPAPAPAVPAPTVARGGAFVAAVVGLSLVSATAVTWLGTRPQAALIDNPGRPEPIVTAFGLTGAAALNFGLLHAFVPFLAGVGDAPGTVTDFKAARDEAWRLGRWGLVPTAASLGVCFVGFGLEHAEFGRGQGVALVGLTMLLVSTLVLDVLEAVGSWVGANAARRVAP